MRRFVEVTRAGGIQTVSNQACPANCATSGAWQCTGSAIFGGALAVADADGDGDADVYATRLDGPGQLYANRGDGTFVDTTREAGLENAPAASAAHWVDLDGDESLELVLGTIGGTRLYVYHLGPNGYVEDAVARGLAAEDGQVHAITAFASGDYDRDGLVDLITNEWRGYDAPPATHDRIFHQIPSVPGTFEDVSVALGLDDFYDAPSKGTWGFTPHLVDLDDDGWMDYASTRDYASSRFYWGAAPGTFVRAGTETGLLYDIASMGSVFEDFDGDGRLDWFQGEIYELGPDGMTIVAPGNRLYRSLGGRRFEEVAQAAGVRDAGWSWGAVAIDLENDGDVDLAVSGGFVPCDPRARLDGPVLRIFRNDGQGHFVDEAFELGFPTPEVGRGLVAFDADGDGDQDLLLATWKSTPRLFRNDFANGRSLRLRLRGTHGNSRGLGARVSLRVRADSAPILRIVDTSVIFGQRESIVHFGVGDATRIAEVRVRWPSTGVETLLTNVTTNRVLDVIEP